MKNSLCDLQKANRSCLLRCSLKANACFSLLCACILLGAAGPISRTIGGIRESDLRIVSTALLVYCAFLWKTARREQISALNVWPFVILDLGWVLGSGGAILLANLTVTGKWVVGLVADLVLVFALAQLFGILRHKANPDRAATTPVEQ